MKNFIPFIVLIILPLSACSQEEVPNHLVFEAKGENWHPILEVKQSKSENHPGKYNYSLSMNADYIGNNAQELERTEGLGVKWRMKTDDDVRSYGGTYSDFQQWIGNVPGGSLTGSNANEFYTRADAEIIIIIEWGTEKEVLPLKATSVVHN
ncbi:hypothetical protein [Halobacillus yeomjeoni]|uniref:Uncharacterized protein n=1 Tax=Halobacillus yeomjeoni TaxID=311194 RepID=A0A931HXU1_9BACI|nr:hypothetical protein [Halobacillus yeomjeoni]MBH0231424.1 hypothetical protein [Halobacillus yeomjeoni]